MSALVKTIKSRLTDDTIYPVTKADAVYMGNSTATTVEGQISNIYDMIDDAITQHNTDIDTINNELKLTVFSSNDYKAASTTYEYVGCSITNPPGSFALVQCVAVFNSGAPNAVALTTSSSTSPNDATTRFVQDFPSGVPRSGYCDMVLLGEGTYYMWVRRNSIPSSINSHVIRGIRLFN